LIGREHSLIRHEPFEIPNLVLLVFVDVHLHVRLLHVPYTHGRAVIGYRCNQIVLARHPLTLFDEVRGIYLMSGED
jgi:hypothetical protein